MAHVRARLDPAVLHRGPPIVLAVDGDGDGDCDCDGAALHVRVRHGGPTLLTPRTAGADSGRGTGLVDLLSSTWGVEPVADAHGPGREVWFELRRERRTELAHGRARPADLVPEEPPVPPPGGSSSALSRTER